MTEIQIEIWKYIRIYPITIGDENSSMNKSWNVNTSDSLYISAFLDLNRLFIKHVLNFILIVSI